MKMRCMWIFSRCGIRRGNPFRLFVLLAVCVPLMWCWLLSDIAKGLLPTVTEQDLIHFQRNRNLKEYLDSIDLLIEPSPPPCEDLVVLVTSSPGRFEAREAIRSTWGSRLSTVFVLGINGYTKDDLMADNYLEAKLHGDIIIYEFRDHYQNLTLKTGLMMKWTLERCSSAKFLFKTDDDVLVNPWKIRKVVEEKPDAALIGYLKTDNYLHRGTHNKWYIPRWLLRDDFVPAYLSGTGYLVNVKYINLILKAAYTIPIINLEDIYFTYLIANKTLGLKLTDDRRLSPYKPWLPFSCVYWSLASVHSLSPGDIKKWGTQIMIMGAEYDNNKVICKAYEYKSWLLY